MIEIVKTPTYNYLYDLIESSKNNVVLCAPYISKNIAKQILDKKNKKSNLTLITTANLGNFLNGSCDIDAIKLLYDNEIKVKNYQNLHAKIYLGDDKAIITSGNLTNNGLYINYEYGIYFEEEPIINDINNDINDIINSECCGEFTNDSINYIKKCVNDNKGKFLINKDATGLNIIYVNQLDLLCNGLSGWQNDILICLNEIDKEIFDLNDIYTFENQLKKIHPQNNNIHAKIRQILQQLRDKGLIHFYNDGTYKKLWKNN